MKVLVCCIVSFLNSIVINAQFGPEIIIDQNATGPRYVTAADIDADGDIDVLAGANGSTVWYENIDGQAGFGMPQIISNILQDIRYVGTADIDGDDALDVITTCPGDDLVLWSKNADGMGNFNGPTLVDNNAIGAINCDAGDFNGDGFMDIVSVNLNEDTLVWYRNNNGSGEFWTNRIVSDNIPNPRFVLARDMDGDMLVDIVAVSTGLGRVILYRNLGGDGDFDTGTQLPGVAAGTVSMDAKDIDADGDLDIVVAATTQDRIYWIENLDGLGNFGPEQIITEETDFPYGVFVIDLDDDEDLDVVSASASDDKIAWYENLDGQGMFGPQQIVSQDAENARSVYAADLDGDGDNDVLSASITGNKIAWYENLTILGTEENSLKAIIVYPNPASNSFFIDTEAPLKSIRLFNALGQEVGISLDSFNVVDVSKLSAGMYTIVLESEKGKRLSEKIILK